MLIWTGPVCKLHKGPFRELCIWFQEETNWNIREHTSRYAPSEESLHSCNGQSDQNLHWDSWGCKVSSWFVCVAVLQPSQPIRLTSTCAHSFTRNGQLLFLNQLKGENDRRNYFMIMINLHKWMLPDLAGIETSNRLITSRMCIWLSHWDRLSSCGYQRLQ